MSPAPAPGTDPSGSPPVTGAWREGDDPGRRHFAEIGTLLLECGQELPGVRLAYETWGRLSPEKDNAVLVLHALTGDSHVSGPAAPGHPTPGWWEGLIGPGQAIDTDQWFVVAPNVLGGCQGSTGPSSVSPDGRAWGSRFPFITVRDQAEAEAVLSDELGIDCWQLVMGGSMGGMRALEWAATHPARVARLMVLACTAAATGDQIAWCSPQLEAIRSDAGYLGGDYYDVAQGRGPVAGLEVARQIAHVTYRSAPELDLRFGRSAQPGERPLQGRGRYAVESYLQHHGGKLARRFDAGSYVVLTESMSSHDVGRGRGGVEAALARITARTVVAGVDSDRLYPLRQSQELAEGISGCSAMDVISSPYGHDGVLLETAAVAGLVRGLLGCCAHPAQA